MKKCNKPETGCDLDCLNCEVPTTEPEYCESCLEKAEENDLEYEANFTHITGIWTCEHCGMGV